MIKRISIGLFPAFCIFLLLPLNIWAQNITFPRYQRTINEAWMFHYFGSQVDLEKAMDSSVKNWEKINLPHTWNANENLSDTAGYRRGYGWYTKEIILQNKLRDKRIFLRFEGANQLAEIYINEKFAGEHLGGYTAFNIDVTDFINPSDGILRITVCVNNVFNKNIPPLSADFTFYGGIYRDVWLIAVNDLHISLDEFGTEGVFISSSDVTKNSAQVNLKALVSNQTSSVRNVDVKAAIYSPAGELLSTSFSKISSAENSTAEAVIDFTEIKNPELWSPVSPKLYTMAVSLVENGKEIDAVICSFGLRFYSIDPNKGFSLNGEKLRLIGTNRHQDFDGLGNALSDNIHERDLQIIKKTGFNFLRLAHYPQDPAVLRAADKFGLILWEEIPIVNYTTVSEQFKTNSRRMLREMIRQHYNHPSVFFWGFMNEVLLCDINGNREKNFPKEYLNWLVDFARELNELTKNEDPSRKTVMAIHGSDLYNKIGLSGITDALGYNVYSGWYGGKFKNFGEFLDREHKRYPERVIMVSEYGAGSDERISSAAPSRFDFSVEYQQLYHESYIEQIFERNYLAASANWNQFDFGSGNRADTKPKINQKGLMYWNRSPKDINFLYKAVLSSEPVIRIALHDQIAPAVAVERRLTERTVKVYSNLNNVLLSVNGGEAVRAVERRGRIFYWPVDLDEGQNQLLVSGELGGKKFYDYVDLVRASKLNRLDDSFELAVNVGSTANYVDEAGIVWRADHPYELGGWGYIGGKQQEFGKSNSVLGTKDDPLFQMYRSGIEKYKFDVENGFYEIEFRFVEMEDIPPGGRSMDILVNGDLILDDLDLTKNSGKTQAEDIRINSLASGDGGIEIQFVSVKGEPILNGIKIKKLNSMVIK